MPINLTRAKRFVRSPYTQVDFYGRVAIDPNIVIYCMADMAVKEINGTVENAVRIIRDFLEMDITRLMKYKRAVKDCQPITEKLLIERIIISQTPKYLERDLPMFSAQDYRLLAMKGNDGNIYRSMEINDSNRYAWKIE